MSGMSYNPENLSKGGENICMKMLKGFEFRALRASAGVGLCKAAEMMCLSSKQLRKIEREDLQIPEFDRLNQYLEKLVFMAVDRLLTKTNKFQPTIDH